MSTCEGVCSDICPKCDDELEILQRRLNLETFLSDEASSRLRQLLDI